ncbi:MAG: glycoside hydrolase family 3 N-terminal domain-containing protein [Gammaproteobacteria bacterium]
MIKLSITLKRLIFSLSLLLLTACGGGGGGGTEPPPIVIDYIPIAVDDEFITDQDTPLTADVSTNDTGLQDAPVTYQVVSAPSSGTVEMSSSGSFTFNPDPGFSGTITFTYSVTDNDGDSDNGTVTITVNEVVVDNIPVANNDSYSDTQGQTLSANVATNDTGLEDTPVTFTNLTSPLYGDFSFNDDGSFSYTPSSSYSGSVSFQYLVTDSDGDSDTATVSINVTTTNTGVQWQPLNSEVTMDVESQVSQLLAQMTTAEKVGQLIMAEIQGVTPSDVRTYNLGAVLNGGGSWPSNNNRATAADWVNLADSYYQASIDTSDGGVGIPIIWGTDAVHGHNNVYGSTIFPHNVGLGAANNPQLMEDIGRLTALQVRATGIDWNFAPTVATVRDDRWGRTYEGYSEDSTLVSALVDDIVRGMQGTQANNNFLAQDRIITTVKHFIGDGGTTNGVDQGNTQVTETELRDIHGPGFYSGLNAGAQTVMASYNSWNGDKLHGNSALLTDVLRDQMGFDGFVLGDWNGHAQVSGCSNGSCAQAINSGVDMIMVPYDWRSFYDNTLAQVNAGTITMTRLNEAVTRILRVKIRAGLLSNPGPAQRDHAGDDALLASAEAKTVARQAVRESLVMLKNKNSILPLARNINVLVAGSAADDIGHQSGGWTVSWQGSTDNNQDFPQATSIYDGIASVVAASGGTVRLSENGSFTGTAPDVAIVVFGETPYSEGAGDVNSLEYQAGNKSDLTLLQSLKSQNIPVVSIFISGRPLWVNAELNASDAFVAAWLPGSEGDGIAEVIFNNASGAVNYDFRGKLSYSWPNTPSQTPLNVGTMGYSPLFEFGYGLTYQDIDTLGDDLDEGSGGNNPNVFSIPGARIEAENYSAMSGIQIENTSDVGGGQNIGFVDVGDWLEYELDVTEAGTYEIQYRLASLPGSSGFTTTINGTSVHTQAAQSTGGWQNWTTATQTVTLSTGRQTMRLDAIGREWNLNWIEFSKQ